MADVLGVLLVARNALSLLVLHRMVSGMVPLPLNRLFAARVALRKVLRARMVIGVLCLDTVLVGTFPFGPVLMGKAVQFGLSCQIAVVVYYSSLQILFSLVLVTSLAFTCSRTLTANLQLNALTAGRAP